MIERGRENMTSVEKISTKTFEATFEDFEQAFQFFIRNTYSRSNPIDPVIRYILEGPGKRARAIICGLSAEAAGGSAEDSWLAATAIEMVHAYSLVHDDLPCMDDDDLRRGRPTPHIKFNEAFAVLAGDGILTDAFNLLVDEEPRPPFHKEFGATQKLMLIRELCTACGSNGMVVGQALDLHWTNNSALIQPAQLDEIHLHKTGALIGAACVMGAITAGLPQESHSVFRDFGQQIGLAFQMIDDLVDNYEGTGKSVGKDLDAGKMTYLRCMTEKETRKKAESITDAAIKSLQNIKHIHSESLVQYALTLAGRDK
jgi:geranylgeranyl pyrophosphate synthase